MNKYDLMPLDPEKKITDRTKRYAQQSIAASTLKFYKIDFRIFAEWCKQQQIEVMPVPAPPETVADFLSEQADNNIAPSTLTRRLAAIKRAHESAGYDSPTKHVLVQMTMRGIRRDKKRNVKKNAATADLIAEMIDHCPPTLKGLRDKALLLLGFAGAFRRSELVALTIEDIEEDPPEGIRVTVRRSKTDQEGRGLTKAIRKGDRFPVVAILNEWLAAANIRDGYIFRPITKGGLIQNMALSPHAVASIVKHYARAAGFKHFDKFSAHSLRSGFLTTAAIKGATVFKMMEVSGHKSIQILAGYIHAANLFAEHAGEGVY